MSDTPARVPLRTGRIAELLADVPGPGGRSWNVEVLASVPSTNAALVTRARAGAPAGEVLVAEAQTAGRGRLGRTWSAPAGSGLTFSALLRPTGVPASAWGWLPLLVGVAAADGVREASGLDVALKWPNDLLVTTSDGDRKLGGILVERAGSTAAVVGLGLNVSLTRAELPVPAATSLHLSGAGDVGREALLVCVLGALAGRHDRWCGAGGDPTRSGLREAYVRRCATLGRTLRVMLPSGQVLHGRGLDVDGTGRLVVEVPDGTAHAVGAGDVLHVR